MHADDELLPWLLLYRPGEQFVQVSAVAVVFPYLPGTHGVHCNCPSVEYVPLGHGMHADDELLLPVFGLYFPLEQSAHADCDVRELYFPGEQSVQLIDEMLPNYWLYFP